jgi:hypothetical protein
MSFVLRRDKRGFLECAVGEAVIAVHEPGAALSALAEALDRVDSDGLGECCWEQPTGNYRWVFRKNGERANVALIWSAGVVTGWEHIWWGEVEWAEFSRESKAQIAVATAYL